MYLSEDGGTDKDSNEPIEDHKRAICAVDGLWILADFRRRLHGKVKAADVGVTVALEHERGAAQSHLIRIGVIGARVEVDEQQHVEEGTADADDERRRHHHVQSVKQFPELCKLSDNSTTLEFRCNTRTERII